MMQIIEILKQCYLLKKNLLKKVKYIAFKELKIQNEDYNSIFLILYIQVKRENQIYPFNVALIRLT